LFAGNGSSWVPLVLGVSPLAVALGALCFYVPKALRWHVGRSCVFALGAYVVTRWSMPVIAGKIPTQKRGCDLLKRPVREAIVEADREVPESLGIASGVAFVVALVLTQAFVASDVMPHDEYASAMLSIVFAVLLGFVDDFLDLEWKYKYVLPPLMSLPLLSAYDGGTRIVPPKFCRAQLVKEGNWASRAVHVVLERVFGGSVDFGSGAVDLGLAYGVYMVALGVFCTNAINIYAGVNGLEAGQIYVIACAVLTMSAVELGSLAGGDEEDGDFGSEEEGGEEGGSSSSLLFFRSAKNHLFSVTLMLPFAATTLALLRSNWFPARVFVGDTFTNYAGMTLAVVAILGHFPIMLMLLMVPQLLNFLLSIPQLVGLRPCPRHRLPTYDETTGKLRASRINDRKDIVSVSEGRKLNLTLINVALVLGGPMTEPALATLLVAFQVLCCAIGLALRFSLAGHIY